VFDNHRSPAIAGFFDGFNGLSFSLASLDNQVELIVNKKPWIK